MNEVVFLAKKSDSRKYICVKLASHADNFGKFMDLNDISVQEDSDTG